MGEPEKIIIEHGIEKRADEDDVPDETKKEDEEAVRNEAKKEIEDVNNELEARMNVFKYAKLGKDEELKELLNKLSKKFKNEKNISLSNKKYKSKFDKFLNEPDEQGNSPQHYAAKEGHYEVIGVLGDKGANLQAKNQNDLTVAQFAARYGEDEQDVWKCIKKIIEREKRTIMNPLGKGIDLGEQGNYGYNILHHAIQNDHWRDEKHVQNKQSEESAFKGSYIIQELIDLKEIKVGDSDKQENSTIHLALLLKRPEVVSFIFDRAEKSQKKSRKTN